jgi:Sjoegren syndrome nuclear autoantigen 1
MRRDELNRQILKEEEEREKLNNEIRLLKERFNRIQTSLEAKYATREDFNKTIQETEAAYMKVCAEKKNPKELV